MEPTEDLPGNIATVLVDAIQRSPLGVHLVNHMDSVVDALAPHPAIVQTLLGDRLTGTPIHPALVHLPIGAVLSAAVLDSVGGEKHRGATQLVNGFALLSAVPTAASGAAWFTAQRDDDRIRTIGSVHAGFAALGTGLSAASFIARARRRRVLARVLVYGSCAAYLGAGLFGGEMVHG